LHSKIGLCCLIACQNEAKRSFEKAKKQKSPILLAQRKESGFNLFVASPSMGSRSNPSPSAKQTKPDSCSNKCRAEATPAKKEEGK